MGVIVEHWREGFKFTWDEEKAKENIEKHGISFEIACWALLNRLYVAEEQEEEDGEQRTAIISFPRSQDCSSLLFVVCTDREDSLRIITARKAVSAERKRYEEENSAY
jgi:uncharacterized protein